MTTGSEFIAIPTDHADDVKIRLAEIQRIRDELGRIRHYHTMISRLHGQVAGLYQTLAKQLQPVRIVS